MTKKILSFILILICIPIIILICLSLLTITHIIKIFDKKLSQNITYRIVLVTLKFVRHIKIMDGLYTQYIDTVCENNGDILEIGFGAGITADKIQNHNINTHTIIEKDEFFFNELLKWAKHKHNINTIKGDWITSIPKDKKYDGIFLDLWHKKEDYKYRETLFNTLQPHVKPGTIFVCATTNSFDEELYIKDGHKYEKLTYNKPPFKWYDFISNMSVILKVKVDAFNGIRKVTYK